MELKQQFNVSRNADFIGLVQMALVNQALAVREEPDNVPNHLGRMQLATRVLTEPVTMSNLMAPAVIAQSKLSAKVAFVKAGSPGAKGETSSDDVVSGDYKDIDISDAVKSIWNAYCYF